MRRIKWLLRKIWTRRRKIYRLVGMTTFLVALTAGAVVFATMYQRDEVAKEEETEEQQKESGQEDPEEILENLGEEEYIKEELALDDSEENERIEEIHPAQYSTDGRKNSRYPYYIKVNRLANCVTVYGQDEKGNYTVPVKAMVCSVGVSNATPLGTFKTSDKYAWRYLFGNVYGQYAYRINGHILFHSVPYTSKNKGTLEAEEYNKLGEPASLGCIRLAVADAKWLVDNCPSGTTVTIYDSLDPGPLGKPLPIEIDLASEKKGWDPTDPSANNPWRSSIAGAIPQTVPATAANSQNIQTAPDMQNSQATAKRVISVPSLITVNIDANRSLIDYLKSKASVTLQGKTLSKDSLKIDISALQGKTLGDYTVTFRAENENGDPTIVKTTVRLDLEAPIIQAPASIVINKANSADMRAAIMKQLSISDNGVAVSSSGVQMTLNALEGHTYGNFMVVCQYSDPVGNRTSKNLSIYLDTEAPVITSRQQQLSVSSQENLEEAIRKTLEITDNSGEACTSAISYKLTEEKEGVGLYTVTVEAKDKAGNTTLLQLAYEIAAISEEAAGS